MEQRRAERQQHGSISSRSNTAAEAAEEENSSSSSSSNSYSNRTPSIHCQDCQGEMRNIQTQIGSNCCASTRNNRHVNHYIFPAQATPRPAWHPHHAGTRTPLAPHPPRTCTSKDEYYGSSIGPAAFVCFYYCKLRVGCCWS